VRDHTHADHALIAMVISVDDGSSPLGILEGGDTIVFLGENVMSTTVIEERTSYGTPMLAYGERRANHHVSWGALFAGAIVALASWILLYAIGLAIGLSSVDPGDMSSAKVAGIGTGIYSLLSPLIALFCGGMVASRLAGLASHKDGALHGVVVWGLTTLAGLMVIGMLLQNIVGATIGLGKSAVGAVQDTATAAAAAPDTNAGARDTGGAMAALGLDYDTLLAPANQRLAAEGLPAVSAEQMKAAVQDAVPQMFLAGSFNREALLNSIAANTALSRAEAEQVALSVEQKFVATKQRVTTQAKETALAAADTTGKAFWAISAALLLGLISAAAGGAIGTPSLRRRRAVAPRPVTVGGPDYIP
jgi:hypothetical protein